MAFETQWREIQARLTRNWSEARLQVTVPDPSQLEQAAALLGPAGPARSGRVLRFYMSRSGTGPSPEAVRRLLRRLDKARIYGRVELLSAGETAPAAEVARGSVRAEWDAVVEALPEDWSDMYAELELRSTDHHDPAALLLSPLNPTRTPEKAGFRFRIARGSGYGGTAQMARRCFERLDEAGIPGKLNVLWAICDVDNVDTQGPVWYVGGRAV